MDWTTSFVVFRIGGDGKPQQVFQCEDFKEAKYWLTYIAEPGDVLCRTPKNARHSKKSGCPEYVSHKVASGSTSSDQQDWNKSAEGKGFDLKFPDAPAA